MPLPPLKSWSETTSLILVLTLLAGCASPTVRRAERLAEEGEWDKAVVVYRDALKTDPFDEALKEKLEAAKQQAAVPHQSRSPYGHGGCAAAEGSERPTAHGR